uniref:Uncharacterized protein MANES_02G065600 n=1 Tax=Rhizophora mucronata TaxID=61149 RepID=A0A2P2MVC8_RHIMU
MQGRIAIDSIEKMLVGNYNNFVRGLAFLCFSKTLGFSLYAKLTSSLGLSQNFRMHQSHKILIQSKWSGLHSFCLSKFRMIYKKAIIKNLPSG